jgi:hypothetical protein
MGAGALVETMVLNLDLMSMELEAMVAAEAAGYAAADELARLEANRDAWVATLRRMTAATDEALRTSQQLDGLEREQVLADLREERARLSSALYRLTGESNGADRGRLLPPGPPVLQASWAAGRVVVWGGGPGALPVSVDELKGFLEDAGAGSVGWEIHGGVPLPGGVRAEALAVPASRALGWLVGVGAGEGPDVGPSVRWLAEMARWATELVAQGRMVPRLRRSRSR